VKTEHRKGFFRVMTVRSYGKVTECVISDWDGKGKRRFSRTTFRAAVVMEITGHNTRKMYRFYRIVGKRDRRNRWSASGITWSNAQKLRRWVVTG
jgi:hypothetical protein